ncbi:MAG TPA: mannose-1-phosphate guanylyltransferase [Planctomycetota bacterium]
MKHAYAVVMAGGGGTRFWPLSRSARPKQTLPILGGTVSMVGRTVARLHPLFAPADIFCVTAREHAELLRPDVPTPLIIEPQGRDTAAAVGLAATLLRARDPEAVFAVLPADHHVADALAFQATLKTAFTAAATGALVTIGIKPRHPSTSYGYLQRGPRDGEAWKVLRFREKPDAETAARLIATGDHYWNGGIFVWSAQAILSEIARQLPDLARALSRVGEAAGGPDFEKVLEAEYAALPRISIDYGVMEKASRVLMVEAGFDWDDVGSWAAAAARRPRDAQGNSLEGACAAVDTTDTLVYSADPSHVIATLGLEGFVVVHTPDATLVCPKDRADELKKVVEELRRRKLEKHL